MHAPLLLLAIALQTGAPVADPPSALAPDAAAAGAVPAPEALAPAADPLAAPAIARRPELTLPRGGLDAGALAAPIVLLAGLAAAAFVLRRRQRPGGRRVQVLETTSLGPKRALVLARLGDELLLLGSSEAGIHLLHTRPAARAGAAGARAAATDAELPPAPELTPAAAARETPPLLGGLVTKLRRARPNTPAAPQFDALLAESAEDQELRRKLARGQTGSVR